MKTTTVKLSICPCGFPVLADEILLGTEYEILPSLQADLTFQCGGCGKQTPIKCVWTQSRKGGTPGWLPLEIFGPVNQEPVAAERN